VVDGGALQGVREKRYLLGLAVELAPVLAVSRLPGILFTVSQVFGEIRKTHQGQDKADDKNQGGVGIKKTRQKNPEHHTQYQSYH
jgi:hypothetical protein